MTIPEWGPYVLEERIAVGGTSEVFLARCASPHRALPTRFVLKRPLSTLQRDPQFVKMFAREGALQIQVEHPNVVRALQVGQIDDAAYLLTEYIQGLDADRLLRRLRHERQAIDPALVAYIGCELLRGLEAVHRALGPDGEALGIVHRDVSPSNVFISRTGEVKLGDFGLAHSLHDAQWRTHSVTSTKGKFAYLAPEQVSGAPSDQRADLFSAAVVIAEMLLGAPLFSGQGQLTVLLAIRDADITPLLGLDSQLARALAGALTRLPDDRVRSAGRLHDALFPHALPASQGREALLELIAPHLDAPSDRYPAPVEPAPASWASERFAAKTAPPPSDREPLSTGTVRYPIRAAYITKPDGDRLGPFTFARLVEAIITEEVARDDQVTLPGESPVRVDALPGLARYFSPLDPAREPRSGDAQADSLELLNHLGRAHAGRATGCLVLQGDDGQRKELYLRRGMLHHVQSNARDELLGSYLLREGLLQQDELDYALAALPNYGGHLGDTLIALGMADPLRIFRAIRAQGRERVLSLFTWPSVRLSYIDQPQPPLVDFPLDLELPPLMLAGLSQRGRGGRGQAPLQGNRAENQLRHLQRTSHGPALSTPLPELSTLLRVLDSSRRVREALLACQQAGPMGREQAVNVLEVALAARQVDWLD